MNRERILRVLNVPHISEKTHRVAEKNNQYVFKVVRDANKPEIKQAVESFFNVKVESVQTLNVKGKSKRNMRGGIRRKPDWKKAYVCLEAGHSLEFLAE